MAKLVRLSMHELKRYSHLRQKLLSPNGRLSDSESKDYNELYLRASDNSQEPIPFRPKGVPRPPPGGDPLDSYPKGIPGTRLYPDSNSAAPGVPIIQNPDPEPNFRPRGFQSQNVPLLTPPPPEPTMWDKIGGFGNDLMSDWMNYQIDQNMWKGGFLGYAARRQQNRSAGGGSGGPGVPPGPSLLSGAIGSGAPGGPSPLATNALGGAGGLMGGGAGAMGPLAVLAGVFGEMKKGAGEFMSGQNADDMSKGLAKIVDPLNLFTQRIVGAAVQVKEWADALHNTNMKFAEFSGAMSQVQADTEVRRIDREQRSGDIRAPAAARLSEARDRYEEENMRWEETFNEIKTEFLVPMLDALTELKKGARVGAEQMGAQLWEWIFGKKPEGREKPDVAPPWLGGYTFDGDWASQYGRPSRFRG